MYPKSIQKLITFFMRFPGVGPRQAARFAFSLLKEDAAALKDFASTVNELKQEVDFCRTCFRSIEKSDPALCSICSDSRRAENQLMILEKEADLRAMEKIGLYRGRYHLLNGVISPLDPQSAVSLHLKEFFNRVKSAASQNNEGIIIEVVLATNPTTEGDTTALYIERILEPLKSQYKNIHVSRLGRGLSLGSELEYADEITLHNALKNRK